MISRARHLSDRQPSKDLSLSPPSTNKCSCECSRACRTTSSRDCLPLMLFIGNSTLIVVCRSLAYVSWRIRVTNSPALSLDISSSLSRIIASLEYRQRINSTCIGKGLFATVLCTSTLPPSPFNLCNCVVPPSHKYHQQWHHRTTQGPAVPNRCQASGRLPRLLCCAGQVACCHNIHLSTTGSVSGCCGGLLGNRTCAR